MPKPTAFVAVAWTSSPCCLAAVRVALKVAVLQGREVDASTPRIPSVPYKRNCRPRPLRFLNGTPQRSKAAILRMRTGLPFRLCLPRRTPSISRLKRRGSRTYADGAAAGAATTSAVSFAFAAAALPSSIVTLPRRSAKRVALPMRSRR